jgi:hypothetical protein
MGFSCAISLLGKAAPRASDSEWQTVSAHGLSFRYPPAFYAAAQIEALPKKLPVQGDSPLFGIGPARWQFSLTWPPKKALPLKKGRYYFPPPSVIYITPLFDRSVRDFRTSYFTLSENATALGQLLSAPARDYSPWLKMWNVSTPPGLPDRLPDEPFSDAGEGLCAKFRLCNFPEFHGFRLLTYYANGITGIGATNEELIYNFQGLTKDGRYYVSARLAVHHPALPNDIDDPRAALNETEKAVEAEQKRVNSWKQESFVPPLQTLDDIISSVTIHR